MEVKQMKTFSDFGKIYYLKKIMGGVLCNLTPLIVSTKWFQT